MTVQGDDWTARFPSLGAIAPGVLNRLLAQARVVKLKSGTRIFGPGQVPDNYLLLIDGSVRVQQVSETGREIVLYRVQPGESCALTTACLIGYEAYRAEGIAETELEAVAIPRATFDDLVANSTEFRRFVFAAFSVRLTEIFRLIEDVAFARIDIRLAQKLVQLADTSGRIGFTHQQLAAELGTAREVVSRQLHEFQRRGWITTARGAILLADAAGLKALAANTA